MFAPDLVVVLVLLETTIFVELYSYSFYGASIFSISIENLQYIYIYMHEN